MTLAELLVVVAIIGILTVLGVPEINRFSSKYRVRACAIGLLQNMRLARSMAISDGRNYLITFDIQNNVYRVGFDGNGDNDLLDAADGFGADTAKVVSLKEQCGDAVVFGTETRTVPGDPSSCPSCRTINAPVSFGDTSKPVRERFKPDGSLSYLGSVFMKHSGKGYTCMVRVSYQSGNINLWQWDGDKDDPAPSVVKECGFPRRQCGWTELR